MRGITSVVNSSNAGFFVFQKNLLTENDKKNLTIQKTIVESKYIDVVCLVDSDV